MIRRPGTKAARDEGGPRGRPTAAAAHGGGPPTAAAHGLILAAEIAIGLALPWLLLRPGERRAGYVSLIVLGIVAAVVIQAPGRTAPDPRGYLLGGGTERAAEPRARVAPC